MTPRTAAFAARIRSRYARAEHRPAPGRFSVVRAGRLVAVSSTSSHTYRWELRASRLTRHVSQRAAVVRQWGPPRPTLRERTTAVRLARGPATAVPRPSQQRALLRTSPVPPVRAVVKAETTSTSRLAERAVAPVPLVVVRTAADTPTQAAAQTHLATAAPPTQTTPIPGWGAPILTSQTPQTPGPPDLRRLAEQVAVHLERRSLAERERRGRF